MRDLLPFLALLACPIGMGLMMLFMGRGMTGTKKDALPLQDTLPVAQLNDERARLRELIERLERSEPHSPSGAPSVVS